MNEELIQLAQKIRDGMEEYVARFNPAHIDNDLMGACAIASYFLMKEAKNKGIEVEFFLGTHNSCDIGQHCWVEYDNHIIDLTATQFGYEDRIFITYSDHEDYSILYDGEEALEDIKTWGEQSPSKYRSYWRNGKFFIRKKAKTK